MAGLGKIIWTVASTTTGRPIAGATVEVRKQGSTIVSGGVTSFSVNDPGAIIAADTAAIGATSSPTRSVSSITATNVTVGAPGFSGTANNDRISIVAPLITLYADAQAAETKSNPLTTDLNGYVDAWVIGGKYDLLVTANGAATLYQDIATIGAESMRSNLAGSGTGRAWIFDTLRALTAGDKIFSLQEAGVERLYLLQNGKLFVLAQGVDITGTLAVSGAVTAGAGLAVTGALSATTTITAGTGVIITSGGLTVTAGNIAATSSLIDSLRLGATGGTAPIAGDFALSAGWGNTPTAIVSNVTGGSDDTRGQIRILSGTAGRTANPIVTYTFKNGTFTTVPFVIGCNGTNNSVLGAVGDFWYCGNTSATQVTFIYGGTPAASSVYELNWMILK